jgi:hypothetical protein
VLEHLAMIVLVVSPIVGSVVLLVECGPVIVGSSPIRGL